MEQEIGINLKENNRDWLSIWALIPHKVIDKFHKTFVGEIPRSLTADFSEGKIESESKNDIKPKRDLIKLIEDQNNFIISRANAILEELDKYNIERKEDMSYGINFDKPIILQADDSQTMNLTLLRIDTYSYQSRILITNLNYAWNTDFDFTNFKNYEINVGDENEELDTNQEVYITIKSKNIVGTVSFFSYGIGEGEFLITWQEDENSVLIELTQVLMKLSAMIYTYLK
ncbi:hypothetical protein REC12_00090 [Desulfosporosinus sp. PR]|uniref:hypothetical protein n=1 Tax=Candidatus Desulfosporosinus nitrosoreducens TaxID=3401928 RepID=UPI0027E9CC81|nr:hypothetical protein [Desulfosporosinus sp. PR]MDQ7091994.1 hypothetical protein [Desulfosporosinus sp. PR]